MRIALVIVAATLGLLMGARPAAADHPWVRLEIGIPIDRILPGGVVYVVGSERYWVPDGYRDYRVCSDRRHRRYRHVHVYYDPGSWNEDDWVEERWVEERWSDDEDSGSDKHKRKHKHKHHRHYRTYREYGNREASGALVLTIPIH